MNCKVMESHWALKIMSSAWFSYDAWACRPVFDDSFLLNAEVIISPAPSADGLSVQWEIKRCRDDDFSPGLICSDLPKLVHREREVKLAALMSGTGCRLTVILPNCFASDVASKFSIITSDSVIVAILRLIVAISAPGAVLKQKKGSKALARPTSEPVQ
jgi:hypothetical protein